MADRETGAEGVCGPAMRILPSVSLATPARPEIDPGTRTPKA